MDEKLETLITYWKNLPFAWGAVDCCQFTRAAVWALHGVPVDHAPYSTQRQAVRVLKALGGYRGLLARTHKQVPIATAQRGDTAITIGKLPFGEALAVVTGTHAHTTGPSGLVALTRDQWLECWRLL